jgi:hypothetical protein
MTRARGTQARCCRIAAERPELGLSVPVARLTLLGATPARVTGVCR